MKQFILLLLIFIPFTSSAQQQLLIRAKSKNAHIVEGNDERSGWTLSPDTKPDIYTISKSPKGKRVKFYTDIDSITVKLKPGQKFDFIVLLNDKDSCFTRLESLPIKNFEKLKPEIHDTIPFELTAFNNIKLKVILDQKDTLDLKFDSGTTDFLLTNDEIKSNPLLKDLDNHSFQLGNMKWEKQSIIPVELSGQGTVGRFGWNLFDGKIVEIDYDKNLFIIHSRLDKKLKQYEKFEMEYIQGLFYIQGALEIKNITYKNRFLFDNGYQRTIMLDEQLMKEQNFPKDSLTIIKKVIMRNGQGKEFPVLTVNNEKLNLGKFTLKNIPVQLLTTSNPARVKTHILGNEVLKRYNTILDFQKNIVYLVPNSLYDLGYTEQN